MTGLSLAATDLHLFDECPRCAWLFVNHKVRRPRSPFPSVLGALDRMAKAYFDRHRRAGTLPPFLAERIPGKLAPRQKLKAVHAASGVTLAGEPDEVLALRDGTYAALDHKSRGSQVEEPHAAHRSQLDAYAFLLRAATRRAAPVGYLAYWIPQEGENPPEGTPFEVDVRKVEVDPARAEERMTRATALAGAPAPAPDPACEFCRWVVDHQRFTAGAPRGGLTEKQVRFLYVHARKAKQASGEPLSRDELEAAVADDIREAFGKEGPAALTREEFEKLLDRYRSEAGGPG